MTSTTHSPSSSDARRASTRHAASEELGIELAQLQAVSTQGARLAGTFLRTLAPMPDTQRRATDVTEVLVGARARDSLDRR